MYSKQDIINSLGRETTIIKHLYEKVTPEMLDYKPTEKQRTMKEHLIYMTRMGANMAMYLTDGKYVHEKAVEISEKQAARGIENFPAMMDEQLAEITTFLQ
jgi:hypothetical protein